MRISVVALAAALLLSFVGVAHADEPAPAEPVRLAVPAAARGLTIGSHNLMLGAEGGAFHANDKVYFQGVLPLRYGVTDDFELFGAPVVQGLDPILHDPALGAQYRFTHGHDEIGIRAAADLAIFGPASANHAAATIGIPARLHLAPSFALDLGVHVTTTFNAPSSSAPYAGLLVPVGATINATDNVFFGAGSGVVIPNVKRANETAGAPLSAIAGYTITSGPLPRFDVGARVVWDNLRVKDEYSALGFVRVYVYP
jgi:hypothetical protein